MIQFSSSLYDKLKFVTQVGLPALGTLYFTLAGIWGLPAGEQVVGTIVALTTFLGVLLQLSTRAYNKEGHAKAGTMIISETGDKKMFSLELDDDPDILEKQNEVTFKVKRT